MVGLEPVRKQIGELLASAEIDADRRALGLPVRESTMHLILSGPPGTGKTTVAREIGQMYYHLGLVDKDPSTDAGFVEASRASLVRPYEGQTADAVRKLFEGDPEARKPGAAGGVVFVDEAYDLYHGDKDNFGMEAITELLRQAENHRNDTVVIMAGYGQQMDRLFEANPGLRRRFPTTLQFPELSLKDRLKVMKGLFDDSEYTVVGGAPAKAALIDALGKTGTGNAGDVRNLFEKIERAQRVRLAMSKPTEGHDVKALSRITLDDIVEGTAQFDATAHVDEPIAGRLVPTGRKSAPTAPKREKGLRLVQ